MVSVDDGLLGDARYKYVFTSWSWALNQYVITNQLLILRKRLGGILDMYKAASDLNSAFKLKGINTLVYQI